MSDAAGEGRAAGVGARLTAARERLALSRVQAADRIHLDVQALQAIEDERFDVFGASVFVRGHLRRYALAVGESPEEIETLYLQRGSLPHMPDLTRTPGPSAPAPKLSFWSVAVAALVCVLAGFVWWALRVPSAHAPASPHTPASSTLPSAPSRAPAASS
jgi:cytoskeletal protein RodZ